MSEDYSEENVVRLPKKSLSYIRRPYAMTVHASQGQSLGPIVTIHEAYNMSTKALRVAITRCSGFDIRVVTHQKKYTPLETSTLTARINSHKLSDYKRFPETQMLIDSLEYVSAPWYHKQAEKQRNECAMCKLPLKTGSIDRIDNSKPHTKRNCQLVCMSCQCASSHR